MEYKGLTRNGFDSSIGVLRVVPEIKTISAYKAALEDAVEKMFKERNERDVLDILSDAKNHGKWPKDYRSLGTENFDISDIHVKKAHFNLKSMKITIRTVSCNITVHPDEIKVNGGCMTKSAFKKEIEFFQQVLKKVEKTNNN